MVNREIVDFISGSLRRGMTYDEIHQQLLMRGYFDFDIQEAMNFLQTGKKFPTKEESHPNETKLGVKWFFLTLGIILFIVFLFIIFGIIFSEESKKSYDLEPEALQSGVEVSLVKNSILNVENSLNESINVTLEDGTANFVFGDMNFVLYEGDTKEIDSNFNGREDLYIEYRGGDSNFLYLKYKCFEDWVCSDWGPCISGEKERVCTDRNSCGTTDIRPALTQECESEYSQEEIANETQGNETDVTNQTGEYIIIDDSNNSVEKKIENINSSIEFYLEDAIINTGDDLGLNYSISVDYENTKVNLLICYFKDGYDRFCGEIISENETGTLELSGESKAFYVDDEVSFTYYGSINYPGIYRYGIYLYKCSTINEYSGVDNCSASSDFINNTIDVISNYGYAEKTINVQGEAIPFECLSDSDCSEGTCVAGSCQV